MAQATLLKTALVFLFAATAAGCSSSDDTSDEGGCIVGFTALSSDATSSGFKPDTAEISVGMLTLLPCLTDAAVLRAPLFGIDLFHSPIQRVLFVSSVTDFCGVERELAPGASGDMPELAGLGALITGTRSDGTTVELRSTLDVTFDFK